MRFCPLVALLALAVTAPAEAELTIESLAATHENGSEYRFPLVAGDSPAAARINTFLQVGELEKLPGRYRETAFEEIWPQGGSSHGTTRIDYAVGTNGRGLLSLTVRREWMGAYPSSSHQTYNFDARSGEVLTLDALFTPEGLARLREQVAQKRLHKLDDFLAGKPVDAGADVGLVELSSDPATAEEQKRLYRECRSRVAKDGLAGNDLTLGEVSMTVGREECAPHALQAIDELGSFGVTLPYTALREHLNEYGRCLLADRRKDCRRSPGGIALGVYRGRIAGRYPITLVISGPPYAGAASAAYFYDKHAARIALRATGGADRVLRLDEKGPPPAHFELRRADGGLQGHWTQEGKPPLEVELR